MAYTTIDDPSAHFQTKTYTGNGSNSYAITNDGNSDLQPDLWWVKNRDKSYDHNLYDSSRGTSLRLVSNSTAAEATATDRIASFDTDGFTLNGSVISNENNNPHVAWQWKANGGTTSSNTNGTLTSTVQANTDAGFSIVEYTTGSVVAGSGGYFSVGHGLGVTPDVVITKRLSNTSSWWTWHQGLTNDTTRYVGLDSTAAEGNVGDMWGNGMTSSVFGGGAGSHYSSSDYIAYCFAEKQGYSKFGSYRGLLGSTRPVYTGFKPAFILIKSISAVTHWAMIDTKRIGYNDDNYRLYPNLSNAENSTDTNLDIFSNGFRLLTTDSDFNNTGGTYIYMAFAENPFVTSTGIPTTAR